MKVEHTRHTMEIGGSADRESFDAYMFSIILEQCNAGKVLEAREELGPATVQGHDYLHRVRLVFLTPVGNKS